ncbi:MAG: hypothetical protein HY699_08265 [Deltaproteobacteria bacterium]|nr:hypothetical protein [Deltaproteobacteria bacterium]
MEQQRIEQQLAILPIEHIHADDSRRAPSWFAAYRLSHGVGMLDWLIAASALRNRGAHLHVQPQSLRANPWHQTPVSRTCERPAEGGVGERVGSRRERQHRVASAASVDGARPAH